METKEVLIKYFGASVFPKEITDRFDLYSTNAQPGAQTNHIKATYKANGYSVKSKITSLGVYIFAAKKKDLSEY